MTNYLASGGVQQFSISIGVGSTSATATINAVGSGAFILLGGINPSASSNPTEASAYLTLTNSTTVTAHRVIGTAGTVVVTGCIIDGDTTNLIKSVQYGVILIATGTTSNTATISAVNNNNAIVHYLGHACHTAAVTADTIFPTLSLSGTTVTATIPSAQGALISGPDVSFVVIEFQGTALNQAVQNVSATSSSSVTSFTSTITSVNTNNSLVIYAGFSIAAVTINLSEAMMYGSLTNGTTVTVNVNTAVAVAKTYNCSVVEFVSGLLAESVQRGTTVLTGVKSNTSTITSSTLSQSAVSWLGNTASVTGAALNQSEGAVVLTNATTVTVSKSEATSNITGSWEIAEFPPFIAAGSGTGSASGTSTGSGVGASTFKASGSSSGIATVSGVGKSTAKSVGSSSGLATVKGQAGSKAASTGVATVSGVGATGTKGVGSAAGVATVTGHSVTGTNGVGNASGVATVTGHSASKFSGIAHASGTATISGIGSSTNKGVGNANGVATVTGHANIRILSVGHAAGSALVIGISSFPNKEFVDILSFLSDNAVNSTALIDDSPVDLLEVMTNRLPKLQDMSRAPVNSTAVMSNAPVSLLGNF